MFLYGIIPCLLTLILLEIWHFVYTINRLDFTTFVCLVSKWSEVKWKDKKIPFWGLTESRFGTKCVINSHCTSRFLKITSHPLSCLSNRFTAAVFISDHENSKPSAGIWLRLKQMIKKNKEKKKQRKKMLFHQIMLAYAAEKFSPISVMYIFLCVKFSSVLIHNLVDVWIQNIFQWCSNVCRYRTHFSFSLLFTCDYRATILQYSQTAVDFDSTG